MRYVIIRDDDTNALTPVDCLEKLYRPFLERGFPVNLATIPNVRTDVKTPGGEYEGFLRAGKTAPGAATLPIGSNSNLVAYLKENPEYRIVHHGWQHDYFEFDRSDAAEIARRLDAGRAEFRKAGLGAPRTFVAPYDKLSREAIQEVAKRFRVLSTGWYELRRLPATWWPPYLIKRATDRPHWRVNGTVLLTHPGCLLSCQRPYAQMLESIRNTVAQQRLTVLVTHWWEYFRNGTPDVEFINILHETAEFLESDPEVRVISFDDVIDSGVELN